MSVASVKHQEMRSRTCRIGGRANPTETVVMRASIEMVIDVGSRQPDALLSWLAASDRR